LVDPAETNLAADEATLHAFVDGCIVGRRRQAVLERLAVDPAAKARAAAFGRQNALLPGLRRSLTIVHAPLPLARLEEELRHLVAIRLARPRLSASKQLLRERDPSALEQSPLPQEAPAAVWDLAPRGASGGAIAGVIT
jgi:anti-sigma factor RsiW